LRFKNVESATSQRQDIALKMAAAPCGAGPNQRLLMLATPRLRALDTGSVTALRNRLFFCVSKKSWVSNIAAAAIDVHCPRRGGGAIWCRLKVLYPLPVYSFLLTPHEALAELGPPWCDYRKNYSFTKTSES
jgi:hypothetical protein